MRYGSTLVSCSLFVLVVASGCGGARGVPDILADLRVAAPDARSKLAAELNKHGTAAVGAWVELLGQKDYGLYVIAAGELGG